MKEELPIVDYVGIVKLKAGWVVVTASAEGEQILGADVFFGPGKITDARKALATAAAELGARKGTVLN